MAHYLVSATPRAERFDDLRARLAVNEFVGLRPFGPALSMSLRNARQRPDGIAVWEEEDYCRPPLVQERSAVLDHYFDNIRTEPVKAGEGWDSIAVLPLLFPELADW